MIKKLLYNIFNFKQAKEKNSTQKTFDFVPLFVFLRRKIKQTEKSEGINKSIDDFLKLNSENQIVKFPSCYLLVEKYLLEIEEQFDSSQQVIRHKIIELFPDLISISPSIQIIFESKDRQELFIFNQYAVSILNASILILGAKGNNHLVDLKDAFLRAQLKKNSIPNELKDQYQYDNSETISSFFKKIFLQIFLEIEDYLGEQTAMRIFENQYQTIASSYAHLQSFAQLINVLPGKVLNEEKINILSRNQIENLLIGKINSLENFNEAINAKNIELETAQKELTKVKDEYKRSSNQFSTVLETIAQGIVTFNNSGIIILVNRKVEEMWGLNRSELLGKSVENLFLPESLNHILYNSDQRNLNKVHRSLLEVIALRKNGSIFPTEMSLSSFYLNKGIFFTAAINNIEFKKQEEQQKEALIDKIRKNNDDLKNYARVVSHDLKTPIRGIKNICEWLDEDKRTQLDAEGQEYLDLMKRKVAQIEQLIEGILEYSKAGIENSHIEKIDVKKLVEDTLNLIEIPQKFDIQVSEKLPNIFAEKIKMKQVFQNLITNAVKYNNKEEGTINISSSEDEKFWYFSVADNGIGIEQQYFNKIFEVFQTLHQKDKFESTGIGLSIVKKIIDQHKGFISVESQLDIGSTFTFSIDKKLNQEKIKFE